MIGVLGVMAEDICIITKERREARSEKRREDEVMDEVRARIFVYDPLETI